MFARVSQTLRNKSHFIISMIAIHLLNCICTCTCIRKTMTVNIKNYSNKEGNVCSMYMYRYTDDQILGFFSTQQTLFGWAWTDRALFTLRTLNKKGRSPPNLIVIASPNCSGCRVIQSFRDKLVPLAVLTFDGQLMCVPIHSWQKRK